VGEAAVGAVGGRVVVERGKLRGEPRSPDGLGRGDEVFVGDVFGGGGAGPRVEIVPRELAVGDGAAGVGIAGDGVFGAGHVVAQKVGEAEVVPGVGGGVGERDVFLIRVQHAGVFGLAGDEADDGAEWGDASGDLSVDALGFMADEDAAVELVVVEQGDADGDILGAPVVIEERLFRAVLIDAEIDAAGGAVEIGAFGDDVDGAACATGAVEQALRAAHDIGALDVEKAVHANAGAEGAGETVATRGAHPDAANAHGLIADAVAGLLAEGIGLGVRHDGARAGAVGEHEVFEVGDADVADEIFGEDIGGDGDVLELGVELGERVGIERAVAVVGHGFDLERIQPDEIVGQFFGLGRLGFAGARGGDGGGRGDLPVGGRDRAGEGQEEGRERGVA
jgi:hypothetical protein